MILHWLNNLSTYILWYSGGRYASLKPLSRKEAEEEAEQQVVLADGVQALHLCRATQCRLESRAFLVCMDVCKTSWERRTWMQLAVHVPPGFWEEAKMKIIQFLNHDLIRAVEYEIIHLCSLHRSLQCIGILHSLNTSGQVINNQWCAMNLCTKTKTLADKKQIYLSQCAVRCHRREAR